MEIRFLFNVKDIFISWGLKENYAHAINISIGIAFILLLAYLSYWVLRRIILVVIRRIIKQTSTNWDDIIYEKKVFNRLAHLAPAFILYYSTAFVLGNYEKLTNIIQMLITIYMILISLMVINSLLQALNEIYNTFQISKNKSIKGYIQVIQIVFYCISIILILSVLLGKPPVVLLTGIGAIAAILILVFKDTILGFVASIQLSANDMLKIGDWISMPKHSADGTVTEITLNTVKVQNWDKTISTIPTYALISESFGNWRGMEDSGGRRIKRHINIDMQSVIFCSEEMLQRFKKIIYLKEYIEKTQKDIENYNIENNISDEIVVNGRRMTNLGTFRKYLELYLSNHPMIHKDMTLLVRHLQPTETGLPIEIYVFSKDVRWAYYESIQADIFDHILAVVPQFNLRVFQNPSGEDFKSLAN